jgi:acetate kinase
MNYKNISFEAGFRLDLLVNDKVIVEIKSVENLAPVHFAQTLTYLKMTGLKLGLLIIFNTKFLKDGIHRVRMIVRVSRNARSEYCTQRSPQEMKEFTQRPNEYFTQRSPRK